jgi:hypothetical protein
VSLCCFQSVRFLVAAAAAPAATVSAGECCCQPGCTSPEQVCPCKCVSSTQGSVPASFPALLLLTLLLGSVTGCFFVAVPAA